MKNILFIIIFLFTIILSSCNALKNLEKGQKDIKNEVNELKKIDSLINMNVYNLMKNDSIINSKINLLNDSLKMCCENMMTISESGIKSDQIIEIIKSVLRNNSVEIDNKVNIINNSFNEMAEIYRGQGKPVAQIKTSGRQVIINGEPHFEFSVDQALYDSTQSKGNIQTYGSKYTLGKYKTEASERAIDILIYILMEYLNSYSVIITGRSFRGFADGTDIDTSKTIIWEENFEVPIKYFSYEKGEDVEKPYKIVNESIIRDNEILAYLRAYYMFYRLSKKILDINNKNFIFGAVITKNIDNPDDRKVIMTLDINTSKITFDKITNELKRLTNENK